MKNNTDAKKPRPPARVMIIGASRSSPHPRQPPDRAADAIPDLENVYRTHNTAAAIFFVLLLAGTTWLSA